MTYSTKPHLLQGSQSWLEPLPNDDNLPLTLDHGELGRDASSSQGKLSSLTAPFAVITT